MSGTIEHSWNGTVLTITSDSGTSSADLKGTKGDTGARGVRGLAGADGITSVNGKKGDITLTASDVGAEEAGTAENVRTQIEAWVEDGYLPLTGGTLTGTLTATELYANNGNVTGSYLVTQTNYYPDVFFENAAGTRLAEFYVDTTNGGYANVRLKIFSDASTANYFTFKNDGIFVAPSDIISNGGILKSSKNTNPCFVMTNQNGAWLASLTTITSDGSYGNAQLAVYKSATESSIFTFSNQGSFLAQGSVYSSLFAVQSNNNPQLMLRNASGAPLGMLYMDTTSGGYTSTKLRVYSSASAYSTFNFGNDGKLSCGSLALATALPISSGGTGSTTASGALANLGALPKSGGTITGSLIVNAITTSNYFQTDNEFVNLGEDRNGEYGIINLGNTNYGDWISLTCSATGKLAVDNKMVYTAGGTVIYSSTQPTGSTGMIWLKPV